MNHRKTKTATRLQAVKEFCTIAKAGITDVIAILALLGVGVNLVWCMTHGKEIEKLKKTIEAQETQQKIVQPFVPNVTARKFQFLPKQKGE